MKSFKELFSEILAADELKKAYETAARSGDAALEEFLKEHGCEATAEDIQNFFKEQQAVRELTEDEIAGVAGGVKTDEPIDIGMSHIIPWQCDPHYSDVTQNGGYICG